MAGATLLTLLDDIATILDDIALLTKAATKKTAGVLGDDLALGAEQVVGVRAEREIPVVLAVARGSAINKLILVPAAVAISAIAPPVVTMALVAGGIYLCFEGFEKVSHKLLHSGEDSGGEHETLLAAVADETVDLVAHEQAKIRGAIRTDLVLSAEIVVITLGIVASEPLLVRLGVLSVVAAMITVGVYGLIAGIVKLDDAGRYLLGGRLDLLGRALLRTAPWLMKALSVAGTAAMFLVGGGIIAHTVPWLHHLIEHATAGLAEDGWARALAPTATSAAVGLATGAAAVACAGLAGRLRHALASAGEGGPT